MRALFELAAAGLGLVLFLGGLLLRCASQALPAAADFATPLVGGYELIRSSGSQIHVSPGQGWSPSAPRIPPTVVELDVTGHHVVAAQKDSRKRPTRYWILDTAVPSVEGPLELAAFRARSGELGLALQLRPVHAFRRWQDQPELVAFGYAFAGALLFGGGLGSRLARSRPGSPEPDA